jgi:hypothetical protein
MAWKTSGSSLLSPTCVGGGYRIFGRSMHRTLMLEVVVTQARVVHITLSLTTSS